MKLFVVSPEQPRADEAAIATALFAAGLERYHLRKPYASAAELQAWIERIPARWHSRLMLHQHHELVARLGLGGYHWKDDQGAADRFTVLQAGAQAPVGPDLRAGRGIAGGPAARPEVGPYHLPAGAVPPETSRHLRSRSCHDLATLRAALGGFDAVFFGPVFPSISKPGYAPTQAEIGEAVGAVLLTRTARERRTAAIAIGGITAANAPRVRELGFDGVAVLGAIWQAADPLRAFNELQAACRDAALAPPAGSGAYN